jgi:hypothetical protein
VDVDLGGLTLDDHSAILEALAITLQVTQAAAARTLEAERPALATQVAQAETRAAEAVTAARPGYEAVGHLQDELAACQQRGNELQAAGDDENLDVRIDARTRILAVAAETASVQQRLTEAHRIADPYNDVSKQADHDLNRARRQLAELDHAIKYPFITDRGQGTEAWRTYLLRTGMWNDQDSPVSRAIVDAYLRRTGYGETLERNAIRAYLAGDPRARSAGDVKHFGDHTLINTGEVPVVAHGQAQPGDLDGASPVQTSWPSGADADAGLRSGAAQGPPPATITKTARADPSELQVTIPSAIERLYR